MPQAAPELRTDRLRLRAHRREDADGLALLWQDPVLMRFFGSEPPAAEDIWNRLLRYLGHWAVNGFGMWAVELQATGAFVGDVGLFEGRRGLGLRFDSAPEAGWVLMPSAHGQGYAREAMRAALDWGERTHGWSRTVCMIDAGNAPSLRTAESLGYRAWEDGSHQGSTVTLLERSAC